MAEASLAWGDGSDSDLLHSSLARRVARPVVATGSRYWRGSGADRMGQTPMVQGLLSNVHAAGICDEPGHWPVGSCMHLCASLHPDWGIAAPGWERSADAQTPK